jgi:hypothetical protein
VDRPVDGTARYARCLRRRTTRSSSPHAPGRRLQPEDFERTGRRRYVERATGVEYDLCHGNPLLGDPEVADVFFAEDGSLWFLRRADRPQVRSQWMGSMGAATAVRQS